MMNTTLDEIDAEYDKELRALIETQLDDHCWNIQRAARALGVGQGRLRSILRQRYPDLAAMAREKGPGRGRPTGDGYAIKKIIWLAEQPPKGLAVIYAIECARPRRIKVGRTGDLVHRVSAIGTDSPARLSVVGWCPGGAEDEKKIHGLLAKHRAEGEWYRTSAIVWRILAGAGIIKKCQNKT